MNDEKRNVYWGAFVLDTINCFLKDSLTSSSYEVFFFMCREMDKDNNEVRLRQVDIQDMISEDTKYKSFSKSTVSKAIKQLCENQYIVKRTRIGYMVNPSLFYTGSNRRLSEKIEDFSKEILKEKEAGKPVTHFKKQLDNTSKKINKVKIKDNDKSESYRYTDS